VCNGAAYLGAHCVGDGYMIDLSITNMSADDWDNGGLDGANPHVAVLYGSEVDGQRGPCGVGYWDHLYDGMSFVATQSAPQLLKIDFGTALTSSKLTRCDLVLSDPSTMPLVPNLKFMEFDLSSLPLQALSLAQYDVNDSTTGVTKSVSARLATLACDFVASTCSLQPGA
jgi:hypothetical protein